MNMIEVKTQDLAGLALNWSVATAVGCGDIVVKNDAISCIYEMSDGSGCWTNLYEPSTDWSQCGPLIEKNKIGFGPVRRVGWVAHPHRPNAPTEWLEAEEPLVAICRAIVADRLGMVLSIPAELVP
ncbi:Protein of unknown function [Pseudomonas koreensis]|uniref:phage protein NinX family protein n=1 Tax=Pseudomonas koreensis TaxID=198620 RepID=UPI00087A9E0A|nr:phage protein NinX family protein [Pseudomonas koreensis]KAB0510900.1 DUF2591 domain-containing protein [Pseudomonas koreensis]NNA64354.1 DUF2591 family protein [Pseudomonas koreensis]GGK52872.1 hypothetical protein GCM10009103_54020 [Pseudomonas koreensis]SDE19102.1 Protein of unknown function [Pseudomonas koreensis]